MFRLCLAVICLLALHTDAQICNSDDPLSGGLFIPAFGSGGTKATYCPNTTDCQAVAFCAEDTDRKGKHIPDCTAAENDPQPGMAVLYLILLLWVFLGVAIAADVFMNAIETITSQTKIVQLAENEDPSRPKQVEVIVWNATVANLTLMALGSSAPEILLSVIEIAGNDFYSGALGPSTIVGSAAFNLMMIIGISCYAIPEANEATGETGFRKIKDFGVYKITASFSILSYVWLLVVLQLHTPDFVDIGEAIITFLMFPVLVGLSYGADIGYFTKGKGTSEDETNEKAEDILGLKVFGGGNGVQFDPKEAARLLKDLNMKGLSQEEREKQTEILFGQLYSKKPKSRAFYRMQASKKMTGGKNLIPDYDPSQDILARREAKTEDGRAEIGFDALSYTCLESQLKCDVAVYRIGNMDQEVTIDFATEGGTATADVDYKSQNGTLTFGPGEVQKTFTIEIVDDDEVEDNEDFYINLTNAGAPDQARLVQEDAKTTITIISDDFPGNIQFASTEQGERTAEYLTSEALGFVDVIVERVGGASGVVSVDFETKDGTATSPDDFIAQKGTLTFASGEHKKSIRIKVIDDEEYEKDEEFSLSISNPTGGATLGEVAEAFVSIQADADLQELTDQVTGLLNMNLEKYTASDSSIRGQLKEAVQWPEGGGAAVALHVLSLPWKIILAFIPPTDIAQGKVTFVVALAVIGLITAVIGDLASLFGCTVGLKDSITAITFVALGTSLPDTFASKTAAILDATADNAVGNVTGSNSVNVLLGLGFPWLIASIYWSIQKATPEWIDEVGQKVAQDNPDGGFYVKAGALGFSVLVFCVCAMSTLSFLLYRRMTYGYELGGEKKGKNIFFATCIGLWFVYVLLSSLQVEGHI